MKSDNVNDLNDDNKFSALIIQFIVKTLMGKCISSDLKKTNQSEIARK